MKDIVIALIVVLFLTTIAYAWQPIYPKPDDFNGMSIRDNFNNIAYYQKTFNKSATSMTYTDIACNANSCIVATLNSNIANYVTKVVPTENQAIVYLDGAAADTASVSILVITK